ncbi:HNH endonuclease signature motif containing protein [Arthrobacter sp. B1I2]|uniref:HNH endonuclease signature motif containing protein n=1 Tax=Arthrobacter sp. B1I2 TaxID=3042263 RepID=UPI0027D82987|nr:HNH endonuclease signature motif containing protein [Arthrobacter sp. B1I2]
MKPDLFLSPDLPRLFLSPDLPGIPGRDVLDGLAAQLAAAALAAPGVLATATYAQAADFADHVERLSRNMEYLQLLAAGTVDRTRAQAIRDAAAAGYSRGRRSMWDADGVETLNETDADWPARFASPTRPVAISPADDGCRNTAEFLRLRLRIPIREARRRLTLAQHTLPGTSLTGQPVPPARPRIAAALAPSTPSTPSSSEAGITETGSVQGPAVSSHAGTLITATLDRLQHHTTAGTLDRIEHHLTKAATTTDPDFLARLAQRWTDTIDADGTEPTEEALRHTQGAFIRKPRHGLHHLEIFATTDQYEHLLTVMNTATNPRTNSTETGTTATNGTASETKSDDGTGTVRSGQRTSRNPDLPDLDRRTRPQKQLDGIITAAKIALATNTLPTTGGNRPQIIATIHYQDLFPTRTTQPGTGREPGAGPGTASGTGAFAFTGPVAAATLRKIACDADIIPALLGTRGEILDLGRKTRLFTPAQRTALIARDQGCAFPNCTIPAPWCEAHHITYWSRGGPSTTTNGVLLCSHHHHLIHKEQWTITTTHDTPTFIPPPYIDPTQTPQQNHYFKPPPPPHPQE